LTQDASNEAEEVDKHDGFDQRWGVPFRNDCWNVQNRHGGVKDDWFHKGVEACVDG